MSGPREPLPCGTEAAAVRHRRRGEKPCEGCLEAERIASYVRKGRPTERYVPLPCGTRAAYERHRRNGETPCDECKAANVASTRGYQATRWRSLQGASEETATQGHQRWTPEEDALVLNGELTHSEMAAELGRTYSSVQQRRYLLLRRAREQQPSAMPDHHDGGMQ